MFKKWLARRFENDEAAKTTFSVLCGGTGLLVLLGLAVMSAWERWIK